MEIVEEVLDLVNVWDSETLHGWVLWSWVLLVQFFHLGEEVLSRDVLGLSGLVPFDVESVDKGADEGDILPGSLVLGNSLRVTEASIILFEEFMEINHLSNDWSGIVNKSGEKSSLPHAF